MGKKRRKRGRRRRKRRREEEGAAAAAAYGTQRGAEFGSQHSHRQFTIT